ncbi:MAG: hypothetical protein N0C83_18170 [Candidatus Thiodiazotropha lotti]|nr:hypothetical protein [Candidatus Thiodiazotropha lotti]MCG7923419.1 hypothetical protein [Candidatus Thiodiazotropha lotti]MCW4201213.1 hypothetical protein [Candidatus Thiodiazotropha lotti]MCW4201214.1 hypothetical protein [Candidatus Thiodiazotropha lotti]
MSDHLCTGEVLEILEENNKAFGKPWSKETLEKKSKISFDEIMDNLKGMPPFEVNRPMELRRTTADRETDSEVTVSDQEARLINDTITGFTADVPGDLRDEISLVQLGAERIVMYGKPKDYAKLQPETYLLDISHLYTRLGLIKRSMHYKDFVQMSGSFSMDTQLLNILIQLITKDSPAYTLLQKAMRILGDQDNRSRDVENARLDLETNCSNGNNVSTMIAPVYKDKASDEYRIAIGGFGGALSSQEANFLWRKWQSSQVSMWSLASDYRIQTPVLKKAAPQIKDKLTESLSHFFANIPMI